MSFDINGVFPWGRRMAEYHAMFALRPEECSLRILDCGGGPASFNAEMTTQGHCVVSCDPLYQFGVDEIRRRVEETFEVILDNVRRNPQDFVWNGPIRTPEELGEARMSAMRLFLEDYPAGLQSGRYLAEALPRLPLPDDSFDLAVVSHFLLLYSEQISAEVHLQSIRELLRVAREVRIFPLLDMTHRLSPHLPFVTDALCSEGCAVDVIPVPYEFQKGAREMLRIRRRGLLET